MFRKYIFFAPLLAISSYATASPEDLFLRSHDLLTKDNKALQVKVSLDAANDSVDFFDMRESEGITDSSAGDYKGFNVGIKYKLTPNFEIEGSYWDREIEYSAEKNKIQTALFGLSYIPDYFFRKNSSLKFKASVWGNKADSLDKSSPTQINKHTIDQINVNDPEDIQIQLDGIFSKKIDSMNQINFFTNIGYSEVKVDSLDILANISGCPYQFHIQNNNPLPGTSLAPCGAGTTISININALGLDIQKDLNYESYYAGLGGSWNLRYRKFESQLGYSYQRLWRKDIDDRISNFGNQPIKDNHTLGLKLNYDLHPNATVFLKGEIYQNNFVGQIPFLYNGVTASRLDKRYGLASVGLTFHAF